jgi:hypothetical protein
LVHRDVKPANVLLANADGREHAYLTDFGLVKDLSSDSSLTATGVFMGTYQYAAPEQIDPEGGKPLDQRADVYALGGVLYHSLAGEVPYPRESIQALIAAHLFMAPPDIRERRPELPPRMTEVIARALAKDPDERFASAGELVDAAAAALATTPPAVEPADDDTVRLPPEERVRGGRRLIAGAAAVVVLIAAIVSVALLASRGDDNPPATGTTSDGTQGQTTPGKASSGGEATPEGQIVLRPVGGAKANGLATVIRRGGERQLAVVAELPPLPRSQQEAAYNVWLYNSPTDVHSLGAQYTTRDGTYRGQTTLPPDYARFKYIDISRQPFAGASEQHSGDSLLRGRIADLARG